MLHAFLMVLIIPITSGALDESHHLGTNTVNCQFENKIDFTRDGSKAAGIFSCSMACSFISKLNMNSTIPYTLYTNSNCCYDNVRKRYPENVKILSI